MSRRSITEQSLAEARDILKLWSAMAVDPKKKALIKPVIDLLSIQRDAPGAKQVTFFLTSNRIPEPAPLIEISDPNPAWPAGCTKQSSCARHRSCMYGCETHKNRMIGFEVDKASEKGTPWELEPGVGV